MRKKRAGRKGGGEGEEKAEMRKKTKGREERSVE